MKNFFPYFLRPISALFIFFIAIASLPSVHAAPPESWHHIKTSLTSLKSGWSSNRHYDPTETNSKHLKTDGCGLVQFELPPLFSASAFDRNKIKIALSLTTYLSGDAINPDSGLEISSINPEQPLSAGQTTHMTVSAGIYQHMFYMKAVPPGTWISPIHRKELSKMLDAFAMAKEAYINFPSGEIMMLKLGHIKPVIKNFQACLIEIQPASFSQK